METTVQTEEMLPADIRTLEELTLIVWPALHTLPYDGWLLCLSEGYTGRANSVQALYPSTQDVTEKIARCEAIYRAQGLTPLFKITPAAQPSDLDAVLEKRGYVRFSTTNVQTLRLSGSPCLPDAHVIVTETPTDDWLALTLAYREVTPEDTQKMLRLFQRIVPETGFATVRQNGETAAVGLAVCERGYLGLTNIVTAESARNQGVGTRLVSHLLAWGQERGAELAFLQVKADNAPALRLYEKFGFVPAYSYWYRKLSQA